VYKIASIGVGTHQKVKRLEAEGPKARPKADSGDGVLGRGQPAPSSPAIGGLGERCKLPPMVRGGRKRIWCIFGVKEPFRWKENSIFSCISNIYRS